MTSDLGYIVYTYEQGATPPCHAYGPSTQDEANTLEVAPA